MSTKTIRRFDSLAAAAAAFFANGATTTEMAKELSKLSPEAWSEMANLLATQGYVSPCAAIARAKEQA